MTKSGDIAAVNIIQTPKESVLSTGVTDGEINQLPCNQKSMAGKPIDNRKRLVYDNFRQQGYSVKESSNLANYSYSYARQIEAKGKKGLLSPYVASAKKAVRDIARGKRIGEAGLPRASDVLHASEMILDREEPKINRQEVRSLSASIEITPEERQRLKESLGIT